MSEQVEKIPSSIERMDIRNGERFREHFCGTLCFVRDTGDVLNFDTVKDGLAAIRIYRCKQRRRLLPK